MSIQTTTLPFSKELDISALARLFANTTNSYKFIFFLSFLEILRRREFDASKTISFRDMTIEMLVCSWYPHTYFKLSFGLQDLITAKLDSLNLDLNEPILKFKDADKKLLRKVISNQALDGLLMRYVPFRILRPFFEEELRGVADHKVDSTIARLSVEQFSERKPLFTFDDNRDAILPHPIWAEYLKVHYAIIKGWTAWYWLEYMQRCNQGVPAVSSKLFPPHERDSLKKQTDYWKLVLKHSEVTCIYTEESLAAAKISLDHYLPWSFVAHDQLWNLIPTLPKVNSSKSNYLPADSYFDHFVRLQHHGLVISNKQVGEQKWEKYIEPFLIDLRFSDKRDLLDQEKLRRAYETTLKPLLELAKTLGFSANWRYQQFGA